MRNLFVLSGIIPTIITDALIKTEFASDENVVIIESLRTVNKIWSSHTRPPGAPYEAVVRHFASLLPASMIMEYPFTSSWPSLWRHPLTYLQEARSLKCDAARFRIQLGARFDRLIYSCNAKLPFAFSNIASHRIMIEHGIGEYMRCTEAGYGTRRSKWKSRIVRAVTGLDQSEPGEIILLDDGRCASVRADRIDTTIITRAARPDIQEFFGRLHEKLKRDEPVLMAEFAELVAQIKAYNQLFLYLPAEDLPHEKYADFLDYQLSVLKPSNALFIIKPHPVNQAEYRDMFAARGHRAVLLSHPLARHLPAEFYTFMFPTAVMVGMGSSSLFYARWWFDREVRYLGGRWEAEARMYRVVRATMAPDIALMLPREARAAFDA